MADNLALLLSAVLGAMAGGMISLVVEQRKRRMEMLSLANAFYGEVKALISKVEQRGYISALKSAAAKKRFLAIEARQNYFEVYEKNCDRLGMLPPQLTYEIAKFYIFAKAFVDDVNAYCSSGAPSPAHSRQYRLMAELLEQILLTGQTFVASVEGINRRARIRLFRVKKRAK